MLENVQFALQRIAMATLWPLYELVVDGKSRYFWLYCVTGFLIAAWLHRDKLPKGSVNNILFARDVWLSRSALNDYAILVFGSLLKFTVLAWAFVSWTPIARAVTELLAALGVNGSVTDSGALACALALTLALFVVDDFCRWLGHTLMHTVPELWEYHKVHHSAEVLNFATAERFHPLDLVISSFIVTFGAGLTNGVFIACFGKTLTPVLVFESNLFLVAFNIAGGVLRHSPIWVSFGPRVERWLISPAMHQIHHSANPKHFDRNMGGALSVWDRMAGTLYLAGDSSEVGAYGIGPETADFRSLKVIYLRPFLASFALAKARYGRMAAHVRQALSGPKDRPAQ